MQFIYVKYKNKSRGKCHSYILDKQLDNHRICHYTLSRHMEASDIDLKRRTIFMAFTVFWGYVLFNYLNLKIIKQKVITQIQFKTDLWEITLALRYWNFIPFIYCRQ